MIDRESLTNSRISFIEVDRKEIQAEMLEISQALIEAHQQVILVSPNDHCIAAIDEQGKPLGLVYVGLLDKDRQTATISRIVHPKFQGRGIGKSLLEQGIDYAKKLGAKKILFYVTPGTVSDKGHFQNGLKFTDIYSKGKVIRREYELELE